MAPLRVGIVQFDAKGKVLQCSSTMVDGGDDITVRHSIERAVHTMWLSAAYRAWAVIEDIALPVIFTKPVT